MSGLRGVAPRHRAPRHLAPRHRAPRASARRNSLSRWSPTTLAICAAMVALLGVEGAWGYWTATSLAGGKTEATATTVNRGATPTAIATGSSVEVSWTATALAAGPSATGYVLTRYNQVGAAQTLGSGCSGVITATTCTETNVASGTWTYSVTPRFATFWVGPEGAASAPVMVDVTAPTNSISVTATASGAAIIGDTVYYRGDEAGSLTLTNAVADAHSGPASSATSTLTGTTTGWTHTPSTVTTPSGGPYESLAYSWAAGTVSSPVAPVTGADVAGNTAQSNLTFVNDSTSPTAGTVSYVDGYQPARSVEVTFSTGTDGGSGIATRRLQRAYATLDNGSCGTFTSFQDLGVSSPVSPYTDATVSSAGCYMYRYVVTDAVGNQHVATSANVSKVDYGGAVSGTTGLLSWWRFGESAITSIDRFTGTAGTVLASHTAADGTTWARRTGDTASVVITGANAVRLDAIGSSAYYTDEMLVSADYLVEADVTVHTLVAGDVAGVVGRLDPAGTGAGTYYTARFDVDTSSWALYRQVNGGGLQAVGTPYAQTLTAGTTYTLGLRMSGSTISLLVDGIVRVSGSDTQITAAGRGGVQLGSTTTVATNSTGFSLDNFVISPLAQDSKGSNAGSYHAGVTLGVAGITPNNTAGSFDSGYAQHMQTQSTTGLPVANGARSVEIWFKTSGPGTGMNRQTLFSYGSANAGEEFGAWLESNGTGITAWGYSSDVTHTWSGDFNDGQWHQYVVTYDGTTLRAYLDGVLGGTTVIARNTVVDQYQLGVGGVVNPSLGVTSSQSWFNGSIDELSFYSTVLDPQTVADHYSFGE